MAEEYARSISKQVVAQLADREGFQLAHGNALDALADVLNRFIREIGTYAKDYAEIQGRTDVNVLDLADGLHDLGFTPEGLLDQAKQEHTPDPFIHSLPEFPVRRLALQPPTFTSSGEAPPAHIPAHLPCFPAAHTMKFTHMPQLRRTEMKQQQQQQKPADKQAVANTDKASNAQEALITLHQRLQATSGAVRPNPFLVLRNEQHKPSSAASEAKPGQQVSSTQAQGVWLPDAMQAFAAEASLDAKASTGAVGGRMKRLRSVSGEQDDNVHERDMDDDSAGPSRDQPSAGWTALQVDEEVLMAGSGNSKGLAAGVALALGTAGTSASSSLQERYSVSRRDAFVDEALVRDGQSRRRMNLNNPENSKKLRAMDILDTGADAILMEYPEGFVPRQGTQRARDDVHG